MISLLISLFVVLGPTPDQPSATSPIPNEPISPETPATTPEVAPRLAEITGEGVNIRSGASTNFYPVTTLAQGDRVVVHEVVHEWAHIDPPKSCYSLITKEFVDPDGAEKGVVNADRVWVHPGSDMYSGPYYAKQLQLMKGQPVQLLGEQDTYYKIAPPEGARLWISADYIRFLEGDTAQAPPTDIAAQEAAVKEVPPAPSTENIQSHSTKQKIEMVEADLKKEFEKNYLDRNLPPYIERFEQLGHQENDHATELYAQHRVMQLKKTIARVEAIKQINTLAGELEQDREQFQKQRQNVFASTPPIETFDVRGELAISSVYNDPNGPRRFRLLDPDHHDRGTIAYVEFPKDSDLDPEQFLGRYVGVRAKSTQMMPGSVDPLQVYIAAEVVILESPTENPSVPVNVPQPKE